jgi:hypothetical protein
VPEIGAISSSPIKPECQQSWAEAKDKERGRVTTGQYVWTSFIGEVPDQLIGQYKAILISGAENSRQLFDQ